MIPGLVPLLGDVNESFWFPPQASTFAPEVDWFFDVIMWICYIFFALIVAGMILFVIWYRRRPGYQGSSEAIHNNVLEVTWTVIPTLIVIWIFARGTTGYLHMMNPPTETIDINVTARKWSWSFQYPNGAVSDELHIPVNKAIRLRMRSEDVLHSFFIPAFRCKTDIVPGRVNIMWFEPTRVTEPDKSFDLFCAEYCGDNHSQMLGKVFVHEEEAYQKWLAEAVKPPVEPVALGLWLYNRVGCKGCHSLEPDKVIVGPSFAKSFGTEQKMTDGTTVKVDEQYIRESILEPQKKRRVGSSITQMQSFQGKLKEDEITALTALIQSLKDGGPPPTEGK